MFIGVERLTSRWGRPAQRTQGSASHQQKLDDRRQKARAACEVVYPGARSFTRRGLLESELVSPSDDWPEYEVVVEDDDDGHCEDCAGDSAEIFPLNCERQPGADTGQCDRRVANRDRFRGDNKEPSSRHRHHGVPDQTWHGERKLEAHKSAPGRKAKLPAYLIEILRDRAKRLVEAERHVPGLACEDRKNRGALDPKLAPRKQVHEEHDGERQKAEHRNRL